MKKILFRNLPFLFVIVSVLILNGCEKEENKPSKTDLLCRTWIWGESNVLMRFQNDGTAVLNDGDAGTFHYLWRWDSDETLLVVTSVKQGNVEKYTVVKITDKELVLTDETGKYQITIKVA